MTTEIIVPTTSPEGIVFYVSADGSKTGVSIRGLERLIGKKGGLGGMFNSSRSRLYSDMALGVHHYKPSKWLEPAWGKVFDCTTQGSDGAKIVTQEAAVAIITYEAVEKSNKVAAHSLSLFTQIGFNTWVKQITNYSEDGKYDKLIGMVQMLMDDVKEMKVKVDRLDRLDGTATQIYPGLKQINDSVSADETRRLLADQKFYTAKEWLQLQRIELSRPQLHRFALLVAETYRSLTHREPEKKYVYQTSKTGKSSTKSEGNGYRLVDFHILESAYAKMQSAE